MHARPHPTAAFALLLLALPPVPAAAQEQPSGATLVAARCLSCHDAPLVEAFSRRVLARGGAPALDAVLARHHAPDAEARAAILAYLATLAPPAD